MTLMIGSEPSLEVMPVTHAVMGDIFISSLMLFPEKDKTDSRRRFSIVAISEYLSLTENEVNNQGNGLHDWRSVMFQTVLNASGGFQSIYKFVGRTKFCDIMPGLESRRNHGLFVGHILDVAIKNNMNGYDIANCAAHFVQESESRGVDVHAEKMWANECSFRANVWNNFVNVSHLWAALKHFDAPTTYGEIPVIQFDKLKLASGQGCESSLLKFLEISNDYLERATAKSKTKPLINMKSAVRLSLFFDSE